MDINIETYEKIMGDAELLGKLQRLWGDNAPSALLAQAIKDAGIDVGADQVDELLAQEQAKRTAVIAIDEVDEEQLKKVAGGSSEDQGDIVLTDCSGSFFCNQSTYEQCTADRYVSCDGYFAVAS